MFSENLITCPTLIVRGDKDFLVEKRHTLELSERINDSNLANIPFCGHYVNKE
ncbi:alpha/beta fold hydrolase [Mariniflexile ostreae]|uniref:Alpha/beta fold hydrolase n=2 Tax=Flavobacteriaceae TaxID=49546 RepID=A0ABV5F910_9FLAO